MVSVTTTASAEHTAPTFVSRVASIPVVVEAYSAVNHAVNTLAEKNKYAKYARDTTNNAVHSVVNTASKYAEPYQQRFAPQISKADETCSKVLDMVESKFPIITRQPAEVLSDARASVSQVKSQMVSSKPVTSASNAVKNLESTLASVMDNVEVMVHKYLPEEESEAGNGPAAADGQIKRAVHLSMDVQRRLARKVAAQVQHLQATIPVATQELMKLKESSHLIQAATESIRSLNMKMAHAIEYLQENAEKLKESSVERAKTIDAQYEIRDRVEPIIKTYLQELSALTDYVQAHVTGAKSSTKEESVVESVVESAEENVVAPIEENVVAPVEETVVESAEELETPAH